MIQTSAKHPQPISRKVRLVISLANRIMRRLHDRFASVECFGLMADAVGTATFNVGKQTRTIGERLKLAKDIYGIRGLSALQPRRVTSLD